MNSEVFKDQVSKFVDTIITHQEAYTFIRKHKLWEGFWKYGWVSRLLVGLAILMGLKFVSVFLNWLDHFKNTATANPLVEMGHLMGNIAFEGYHFLFDGGLKYVMLILLEVIIFHICRRTLEILTGESSDMTFKNFRKAQIRMLKVTISCYFMEMGFTILIKIAFGIFGTLDFLEPVAIFAVQCYFLGLLFMDNYNEQFHLTIKESLKYARSFIGVSLALGLVLNILLMVPVIGAIVGPVLGAVTVTLVMQRFSDLHLRTEILPDTATQSNPG